MKVEIWSDVMCPFCYIGKRKFELALTQYQENEKVDVIWKSFRLNPSLKTDPGKNTIQHLAEIKGWTLEHATEMNNYVTSMAKEVGLTYNLDKAIVANSLDAHRLSHLAKKYGRQNELEEILFAAYFTGGKNTADYEILTTIGIDAGLVQEDIKDMLQSDKFKEEVEQDENEATKLGIRSVPYFIFNRKYAISGAQPSNKFLEILQKIKEE